MVRRLNKERDSKMGKDSSEEDHYYLGVHRSDLRRYELFNEVYQPATEMRLATLAVRTDARILDVGCGIGRTACYFATEVVPDGEVVGFDQSEELVGLATQLAADQGIGNVTFYSDKAEDHQFEPAAYDLAHTRYVLSYSPFAAAIVEKIAAALKPGGIFFGEEIVQDYVKVRAPPWCESLFGWFEQLIALGGGDPNYGRNGLPSHMLDAGLTDLTVTSFAPVADQPKLVEMCRLALSNEMRKSLVDNGLATEREVLACVDAMNDLDPTTLISVAPAYQVTGVER